MRCHTKQQADSYFFFSLWTMSVGLVLLELQIQQTNEKMIYAGKHMIFRSFGGLVRGAIGGELLLAVADEGGVGLDSSSMLCAPRSPSLETCQCGVKCSSTDL